MRPTIPPPTAALGLAVPAAQIVAAGALMRRGVPIKDGSALERLVEADRALFDKTGTLTLGRSEPVDAGKLPHAVRPAALALARASSHPLSVALRHALEAEGVRPAALTELVEEPGFGMRGRWDDCPVSLGRPDASAAGQMAVAFVSDDAAPIVVHFRDLLRPEAAATLRRLERLGLPCSIVSGDRAAAVAPIAGALGLTAQTGMRPQDKLDAIARLAASGHKVLMVGDGLNDGPALAAGHVSMAPASASDVGQTAADAVFLGDSLAPVATAILVARRTMRVVRQNFAIAIAYNALAVPLALAGLVTRWSPQSPCPAPRSSSSGMHCGCGGRRDDRAHHPDSARAGAGPLRPRRLLLGDAQRPVRRHGWPRATHPDRRGGGLMPGRALAFAAALLMGASGLAATPGGTILIELCDAVHPGRRVPLPLGRDRDGAPGKACHAACGVSERRQAARR
jgi:hypothetical protein